MARILVVDDDVELEERITSWLTFLKHAVVGVHSGAAALEQLQFREFDLMVIDWQLQDLSGLEVCKEVRQSGLTLPIILLTGRDGAVHKEEGLAAGASWFMQKPFTPQELSNKVDDLLRLSTSV